MFDRFRITISAERANVVIREITIGSEPKLRFYLMVAASSILASFGLVQNSTAVVIGAMLVAPLMTPIFGIALALVTGDAHLLGRAMQAEIVGVFLAVFLALCMGLLIPELEPTGEMLARTKPSLLDLLIAIFAGFAGAYAMVDENISPALPGVAIATAIVPPLANTGLSLAMGFDHWAIGSFLLFFANFLSILLVSSLVFLSVRSSRGQGRLSTREVVSRFSLALVGFCVLATFLSRSLLDIIEEQYLRHTIQDVLRSEMEQMPASDLEKLVFRKRDGQLYVLAHVHASEFITPARVKRTELAMEQALERPIELFFRSTLSKAVSAQGSFNHVSAESLGGFYESSRSSSTIRLVRSAEQTLREFLDRHPTHRLENVNLLFWEGNPVIMATINGPQPLLSRQVSALETDIRNHTGNTSMQLILRHVDTQFYDRNGKFYYSWLTSDAELKEGATDYQRALEHAHQLLGQNQFTILNSTFTLREGVFHLLLEVTGPQLASRSDFDALRNVLEQQLSRPLRLYIRSRPEVVITDQGITDFGALQEMLLEQAERLYDDELEQMRDSAL